MKAITQDRYGSAEVLEAREIDVPEVAEGQVLVRVHAASIHVGDWILMTGSPRIMRLGTGLTKPKNPVPGTDIAGIVEAIGPNVQSLRPGDEVFGWCAGAFAEYASAPADQFVTKPANLTFEQAAAVGVSATTALQLLRDDGGVQPGQKVLVNGASGGVGSFAVQIAKAFGAEVTGVSSTKNLELLRSIGADHVVDYTQRGLQGRPRALRRHPRQRGRPLDGRHAARTHADRDPDLQWRGALVRQAGSRHSLALVSMVVRQQARPSVKTQNRADLAGPEGSRRGRQGHAGHRRHVPAGRDRRGHRPCGRRTRARDPRHRRDPALEPRRRGQS